MSEENYRNEFQERVPLLEAFGEHVTQTVIDKIKEDSTIGSINEFLKLPPKHRVKDVDSFIGKIFRKGKNYKDPINDITDQVGIRFVVLYYEDIEKIGKIVESNENWEFSCDRDIEEEIEADPHHFSYQSRHYVINPKQEIETPAGVLTPEFKCEVQIRTLLQHAYAELAHDTTYKPSQEATAKVKRSVAKTSALIETTDNIFMEVKNTIEDQKKPVTRLIRICRELYEKYVDEPIIENSFLSEQILLPYMDRLEKLDSAILDNFFKNNPVLSDKIRENRALSILFKCAEVLAIYYVVRNHYLEAKNVWEHDSSLMDYIYADLGISHS